MPTTTQHPVFISYSRTNIDIVNRLMNDLMNAGIRVWIDQVGLKPGTRDWDQALRDAIHSAEAILLVASPSARRSAYVRDELALADMEGKPIIPLWVEGQEWIDSVPLGRGNIQYIDCRPQVYEQGLQDVIDAIEGRVDTSQFRISNLQSVIEAVRDPMAVEGKAPRNPYKGLSAFRSDDSRDFFGRQELIEYLIESLNEGKQPPRFLCLVGPSGSGKSSVMMAGLLPALQSGVIADSQNWIYAEPFVPGVHPEENLAAVIAKLLPQKSMNAILEDIRHPSARGLHLLTKQITTKENQRLVLYVDQLEELFTLTETEEERQAFIDVLTTAVEEADGQLVVLCTLRADFYDRPLEYPLLGALMEDYAKNILPLTLADLYEVVQGPASLDDVRLMFDEGLIPELVFSVREQIGALPLLQFTLTQLFEQREGRRLTRAAYEAIGGVQGALAKHAEQTYQNLPSDQHRVLARVLFLRLIEPGTTELETTRRRARLSELDLPDAEETERMHVVADRFLDARLLVTSQDTIEVSHEALIREWERLSEWLYDAREDIRLQKTVASDAENWVARGRHPTDDALYRGTVLEEAVDWSQRNMAAAYEMAFIEAGIAAEQARAEHEIAMERRARQLRQAVFALMVVAVLASSIAAFSLFQSNQEAVATAEAAQATVVKAETVVIDAASQVAEADSRLAIAQREQEIAVANAQSAETQIADANGTLAIIPVTLTLMSNEIDVAANERAEANDALVTANAQVDNANLQIAQGQATLTGIPGTLDALSLEVDQQETHVADSRNAVATAEQQVTVSGNVANSVIIAAFARSVYDTDNILGIQLAVEANRIDKPPEAARNTLLDLAFRPGPRRMIDLNLAPNADISSLHVALSSDGRYFAVSQFDQITIWYIENDEPLYVYNDSYGNVQTLAFVPNSTRLLAGDDQGYVLIWDVESGTELRQFTGHLAETEEGTVPLQVVGLLPTSDGQRVISVACSFASCDTARILNWRIADLSIQEFSEEPSIEGTVQSVALSSDNQLLAIATSSNAVSAISIVDLTTGHVEKRFGEYQQGVIQSLAFGPNGQYVLASITCDTSSAGGVEQAGCDNELNVWHIERGELVGTLDASESATNHIAVNPLSGTILTASQDGGVYLWHWSEDIVGIAIDRQFTGHHEAVLELAYTANGQQAISIDKVGRVILWDLADPDFRRAEMRGHREFPVHVMISQDGRTAISAGWGGLMILWDLTDYRILRTYEQAGNDWDVAFLPDGQHILSSGTDGRIVMWDFYKVESETLVHMENAAIRSIALSPNGRRIVFSASDDSVYLWDMESRRLERTMRGHTGSVLDVDIDPIEGRYALSGDTDGLVIYWDTSNGNILHRLQTQSGRVWTVAFSPDGRMAASGGDDGFVILWNLESGEIIHRLRGHTDVVFHVSFSPDGQRLISTSFDSRAILWDVVTGEAIRQFEGHQSTVTGADFTPDGRYVLTGSVDNSLILWLSADSVIDAMNWVQENRVLRGLSCAERAAYEVQPLCVGDEPAELAEIVLPSATMARVPQWTPIASPTASNTPTISPTPTDTPPATATPELSLFAVHGLNQGSLVAGGVERWAYEGETGEIISLDLTSGAFDTTLTVFAPTGEIVLFDDDGGEGLNSRIENLALPVTGVYVFEVASYSGNGAGNYTLLVISSLGPTLEPTITPTASDTPLPSLTPTETATPIMMPEMAVVGDNQGDLPLGGGVAYGYEGEEGEYVTLALNSPDFDTTLTVYGPGGERLAFDDDSGEDYNSLILGYALPESGVYTLVVRSYANAGSGQFTLSISTFTGNTTVIEGRIQTGGSAEHVIEGQANHILWIDLTSEEFDTTLTINYPNGELLAFDDDGGDGYNSRLSGVILPEDGEYTLVVRSYADDGGGTYTLLIAESEAEVTATPTLLYTPTLLATATANYTPSPTASPTSVPIVQALEQETITDELAAGETDAWTFDAEAGQVVIARVQSSAFDTVIQLRDPNGIVIGENDDFGYSSDSRLIGVRLSQSGQYTLEVRSYSANLSGSYQLSVQTMQEQDFVNPQRRAVVGENFGQIAAQEDDVWTYQGQAGEIVSINLATSPLALNTELRVVHPDGRLLNTNDFALINDYELIVLQLPDDGLYRFEIVGLPGQMNQSYLLAIRSNRAHSQALTLPSSDVVRGQLEVGQLVLWSFDRRASETVTALLDSDQMDALLLLLAPDGSLVAYDDDGGDGFNSLLQSVNLPQTGTYTLIVSSYGDALAASYELGLYGGSGPTPTPTYTASPPGRAEVGDNPGVLYVGEVDAWQFQGSEGDIIQIDLSSENFDSTLSVLDPSGNELAFDDDEGEGLNARIAFLELPSDGVYIIEVGSYENEEDGAYTLSIRRMANTAVATYEGTLETDSSEDYEYEGLAGETITVDLTSSDFDTTLTIYDEQGNQIAFDDDGGEGLNSRLVGLVLPTDETFTIRVRAYNSSDSGDYRLRIYSDRDA